MVIQRDIVAHLHPTGQNPQDRKAGERYLPGKEGNSGIDRRLLHYLIFLQPDILVRVGGGQTHTLKWFTVIKKLETNLNRKDPKMWF